MAVYDGVPSIRLEGDEERALALIPEAKALLYKVQTIKRQAGVGTFSMSHRVDDDSTIYVLSARDQNIIHIAVASEVPEMLNPEVKSQRGEGASFPDFYSGLVYDGVLEERTRIDANGNVVPYSVCVSFSPTPACRRIHKELSAGRQAVQRLAVRPWTDFNELNNNDSSGAPVFTQYTKLRSSMYSGTMKKVVQVVMGFGRIDAAKLQDPNSKESNKEYIDAVAANGVQVRYDWRFFRTHGITVGADNRLWLVEISQQRGVLARPLPIFPQSTTEEFRARAEARGDSAMVYVLDELGCLPTGETFPGTVNELNRLIERGEVLRLLEASDLSDFYRCSAYSSAMGWAFNERGNEAHNTAYYFGDDGFQRGVWYQIGINIGAIKENWEPGEPIANASASLHKMSEGFIYCPPAPGNGYTRYVPIKFYEPLLPGLLSHEGVPSIEAIYEPPPMVDTPMFVSFVNGELKVVKYYRNPQQEELYEHVEGEGPDDICPVAVAGKWTITTTSGLRGMPTMMYTNDFDDRKVVSQCVEILIIEIKDLGYEYPTYILPNDAFTGATPIFRVRVFQYTNNHETRDGETVASAVVIPQYSREAYYYAVAKGYYSRYGYTTVDYYYITDPNIGVAWRCPYHQGVRPFFAPCPGVDISPCISAPCPPGVCLHRDWHVIQPMYLPSTDPNNISSVCYHSADSGPWLQICQKVKNFNPPITYRRPVYFFETGWTVFWEDEAEASLYLVSPGYGGPLSIPITANQVINEWMAVSPDPSTGIAQHISAEHSAIGNNALVYSTVPSTNSSEKRVYGYVPDSIKPDDGFPAFIGVNGG